MRCIDRTGAVIVLLVIFGLQVGKAHRPWADPKPRSFDARTQLASVGCQCGKRLALARLSIAVQVAFLCCFGSLLNVISAGKSRRCQWLSRRAQSFSPLPTCAETSQQRDRPAHAIRPKRNR